MHASETRPASRKVPVAGSVQRSWPWQLFVVLLVLGAAVLATPRFSKPPLALSLARISYRTGGCSAEFAAVNNTDQPTTAVAQVSFGLLSASEGGASYQELARTEVPIALMPRQRKSVACDFSPRNPQAFFASLPNTARVEIISYHPQTHESAN